MARILPFLFAALFASPSVASAQGNASVFDALSLRGFGTLGLARTTNGQAEVARDLLQPKGISDNWSARSDSDFGIQANYSVNDTVEVVTQAVSRYSYKGNFTPELTELLVKYDPNAYLSLRGGRIGTDFFMHGDSRLIGYSQLTVRPNIDFFSSLAVTYLDGADGQVTLPLGEGLLRGKLYYGFLAEKLPFADGYLNLRNSRAIGGYLDYQSGNWQWRAGLAGIRFKHSMPEPIGELQAALRATGLASAARAAADLDLQGTNVRYYSFGVVYDRGPLFLQAMLGHFSYETRAICDQDSAMFLAGYRMGDFKPFLGYSKVKSKRVHVASGLPDAGQGALINAALTQVPGQSYADQHTVSMGVRWDFRRDMALKLQADLIRGQRDSAYMFRRESLRWDGDTNIFSLALDFVF
jgi:hypothetical protein